MTRRPGRRRLACFPFEGMIVLLLVASGIAAGWMTFHRHEGYDILCARPSDLYQLSESVRASDLSIDAEGRLTIELENLDESGWAILDGDLVSDRIEGGNPVIPLSAGIVQTVLRGEKSGLRLNLRSQWIPGQPDPLVSLGSIRIGAQSPFSIDDFVARVDVYPQEDVVAARRILSDLDLDDAASVPERAAQLAAFLHQKLEPHRGSPSPQMARLNGFEQYSEALAGRSDVYCANHAEIFAFMANVAGMPTRLIDVAGTIGDVVVGAHSFVEIFVKEEARWIYFDLQLGLAGVSDERGRLLSARELLERIRSGTASDLMTHRITDGRIVDERWSARGNLLETFLSPTSSLVFLSSAGDRFSLSERLKRLLLRPRPAICEGALPERTALRLAASWLTIAFAGTWLALRARHVVGLCACPRVEAG